MFLLLTAPNLTLRTIDNLNHYNSLQLERDYFLELIGAQELNCRLKIPFGNGSGGWWRLYSWLSTTELSEDENAE